MKRFAELDLDRLISELWARVEETSLRLRSALVPLLTDLLVWAYRLDWLVEPCVQRINARRVALQKWL